MWFSALLVTGIISLVQFRDQKSTPKMQLSPRAGELDPLQLVTTMKPKIMRKSRGAGYCSNAVLCSGKTYYHFKYHLFHKH